MVHPLGKVARAHNRDSQQSHNIRTTNPGGFQKFLTIPHYNSLDLNVIVMGCFHVENVSVPSMYLDDDSQVHVTHVIGNVFCR